MTNGCLRVGLTGGIGSGKSTVAGMLAKRGAALLDSDLISRASTASGGAAMPAIARIFGPEFVDDLGALNRERMRALVFSDPSARRRLEAIVHPVVQSRLEQGERVARAEGYRLVVLDIPLLVESERWTCALDAVMVVDCRVSTQISRVMQRNAMSRPEVEAVIASQATALQRRGKADAVVWNDEITLPVLDAEVGLLAKTFGL